MGDDIDNQQADQILQNLDQLDSLEAAQQGQAQGEDQGANNNPGFNSVMSRSPTSDSGNGSPVSNAGDGSEKWFLFWVFSV